MLARLLAQEDLNFLLTNRIPRELATRFMGWFSRIEQPLVRDASLALWRLFADLRLEEARQANFSSLHDCFIRELKEGARPADADPAVLASPCDAIVGACGRARDGQVFQAKGFPYTLHDLVGCAALAREYRDATYATLRITASMYHRFHAPHDCRVHEVRYFSGDTWNVNPIALQRIERLFCRNERALLRTRLEAAGHQVLLVPVAAVLVASIRLHCLDVPLHLRYRGPERIACDARYAKGQEMGWFEHGSTILVFAPAGFDLCGNVTDGAPIRAGEPLMRLAAS
ncbi:MAG TPA: archaetidylserine decarboxylase [Burkholderiales bacterium]|jgi:phosphatidylserine decarboxylase|nr:archaetidylserine decarboxylase [Burkholderiales bacterium]